jgi:hypothetical protein
MLRDDLLPAMECRECVGRSSRLGHDVGACAHRRADCRAEGWRGVHRVSVVAAVLVGTFLEGFLSARGQSNLRAMRNCPHQLRSSTQSIGSKNASRRCDNASTDHQVRRFPHRRSRHPVQAWHPSAQMKRPDGSRKSLLRRELKASISRSRRWRERRAALRGGAPVAVPRGDAWRSTRERSTWPRVQPVRQA